MWTRQEEDKNGVCQEGNEVEEEREEDAIGHRKYQEEDL